MKICSIGGATQDLIASYHNAETLRIKNFRGQMDYLLLEEGQKIELENLGIYSGGGATNSAASFVKQGFDVSIVCKVGKDIAGDTILDELKTLGVDTQFVREDTLGGTGTSVVIPSPSGDRVVLAYRGSNGRWTENDIPFDALCEMDQLYVTSLSDETAFLLPKIVQKAHDCGVPVAANPGKSQLTGGADTLKKCLPYIDTLILNTDEAKLLMVSLMKLDDAMRESITDELPQTDSQLLLDAPINFQEMCFSLRQFFQAVLAIGPQVVVVTDGSNGVYVADSSALYFHDAIVTSAVNTLGAGDAFGSSFVAALARNKTLEKAIQHGLVNSANVIQYSDAKSGLLGWDEIEKRAAQVSHSVKVLR